MQEINRVCQRDAAENTIRRRRETVREPFRALPTMCVRWRLDIDRVPTDRIPGDTK